MALTKKREGRQAQIYKQALHLFARFGYQKTTIEDVARAMDMTKGNLYFYVINKEDLYHRTIHWALTQWQAEVEKAVADQTDPPAQFKTMAVTALEYIEQNPVLQDLLARDPDIFTLDREQDRFPEANQAARNIIRSILERGIEAKVFHVPDPQAATEYLFSLYMMFLIQTYVYMEKKNFLRIFESALDITLGGLSSPVSANPNNKGASS